MPPDAASTGLTAPAFYAIVIKDY